MTDSILVARWASTLALLVLLAGGTCGHAFAQDIPAPDPTRPWLARGDSLVAAGKGELARDAYREALKKHSDDVELWLRVAAVETALGDPRRGMDAAQKARKLDPKGADPYLMLAQAQFAAGDASTALKTLEAGVSTHEDDIPLLEALVTVKIAMKKWAEAGGLLRQLILLDGSNPMYYMDLGRIQHRVGEMNDAYSNLKKALNLGASRSEALALLGHVCLGLGRMDEAKKDLEESLSIEPSSEAWSGLAGYHFLQGDAVEAEKAFRESLRLDPNDPDSWFNLGNALVVQEKMAEAEEAYRKVIKLDPGPSSAAARLNLGVLLLTREKVDEAKQSLSEAARLNPQLPGPHLHLARIAGARFHYEEAKNHYLDYRKVVPDEKEKKRIDGVLADLEAKIKERNSALSLGEVHLLQIMTPEKAQAEKARARVQQGEDFYSVGESLSKLAKITGIDIGYVDPASLNQGFRSAIVALKVGDLSEVVKGPNGWYLFQRVE